MSGPPYLKLRRKLERMLLAESLFLTKDRRSKSRVRVRECREDVGLVGERECRRARAVGRVVSVSSVSVMVGVSVGKWYSGGRMSACRSTLSLRVMGICDVSSDASARFDVILKEQRNKIYIKYIFKENYHNDRCRLF